MPFYETLFALLIYRLAENKQKGVEKNVKYADKADWSLAGLYIAY